MTGIVLEGVTLTVGDRTILHKTDLEIREGELAVVLGPSGCGKSTLLRLIAGLEKPTRGRIWIGGEDVTARPPGGRACAMVFQNHALYPHMTVAQNIGYPLRLAGHSRADRARRVAEMAASLDLADLLDRQPSSLSGGQQQRVALGRALIREPKAFLLDEPMSSLDAHLRGDLRSKIRRLHDRIGTTSLLVTHDQAEAMSMSDRLIVMDRGLICQIGRAADVYDKPDTLFVAGFVGFPSMNLIEARIHDGGLDIAGRRLPAVLGDLPPGSVLIGIRPEAINIDANGQGGDLTGAVAHIDELGSHRVAHVQSGDAMFLSPTTRGDIRRGSQVALILPRTGVHVFDRASGLRIGEVTLGAREADGDENRPVPGR